MKILLLSAVAALLMAGCSTAFVTPFHDGPCPACGYLDFDIKFVPAHWPVFINGHLDVYDQPVLKTRCCRCGYEFVHEPGGMGTGLSPRERSEKIDSGIPIGAQARDTARQVEIERLLLGRP